jgi:hypothetical protein
MHEYEVVERSLADSRLTLRGTDGRYHQTKALNLLPPMGAVLLGARPHLGFAILLSTQTGNVFPVVFESVRQAISAPQG